MPTPDAARKRRRLTLAVVVLGIIASIALVSAGAALRKARDVGFESRRSLCHAINSTRALIREQDDALRSFVFQFVKDPERRRFVDAYFDGLIARAKNVSCLDLVKKGQP